MKHWKIFTGILAAAAAALSCAVTAVAAEAQPRIILRASGAANQYILRLEDFSSRFESAQFDITIDDKVEAPKVEWRDDSAAHFQRIDTAQAGDQTVLTVYIDRLRPIANSGSTELAAITFSKSLPTEAFGAGAELIALDGNQEETVYASPALTVQGYSGGDDDRDNGVRDWDDVSGGSSGSGDSKIITVKLSPGEYVSQEVFVRAAEEKRNLRLDYGNFIWTFDTASGVNIPAGRIYYDFSVEKLDYRNLSAAVNGSDLLQFEIAYSGALPCKATLACRVGDDHAGETVYLAYYDEAAAGLSGRGSAKVDADGWAAFAMTHASSYVISAKNLWPGPVQPETGGPGLPIVSVTPEDQLTDVDLPPEPVEEAPIPSQPEELPTNVTEPEKTEGGDWLIPTLLGVLILVVIASLVLLTRASKKGRYGA